MSSNTLNLIKQNEAKWVDVRFTDLRGKEQHLTVPASSINDNTFKDGFMFDGSSIAGWQPINNSDMCLLPDDSTAVTDPFTEDSTIIIRCDIIDPITRTPYTKDPRSTAKKAEAYLKASGIASDALFGPEPEFFIFDEVKWKSEMSHCSYQINSEEGHWSSNADMEDGNPGHRPKVKGGYFPVPPVDSFQDIRNAMCQSMEEMNLTPELHHHEVATAGQNEIGVLFNTLVNKADEVQIYKYCVLNVAFAFGKTATFMPKPLVGDNGSGMHVHQSLSDNGKNIFHDDNGYAQLSETALYYIGGIIKHSKAINAFANASTNSYKRLVPGFEAPVMLAYSARNRSASIRIPYVPPANDKARRIEARFPDATANPYLAFSALLMAGLDGIKNKIHPGDPSEIDLYEASEAELKELNIDTVCSSLEEALDALDKDRDFLKQGDVFSDDLIDSYIELKKEESDRLNHTTHPVEFDMYFSV